MKIGIPNERYPLEKRVIILPSSAKKIVEKGHEVFVESNAGEGINVSNDEYAQAGAKIVSEAKDIYELAEMIVKVKAPLPTEFSLMQPSILFCMFHSEQNKQNIYYAGLQNLVVVEMEQIRDAKHHRLVNQTDITGEAGVYYVLRHSQKMPSDMFAVVLGYGNVSSGALKACHKLGIKTKILRKSEVCA